MCSIWFGLRNEAIVSLIWDFWGPKGLLCDPKTGRKLLLGQKHTEISFTVSQEEDFKKEELQDLVIWGGFPGYLRNVLLDLVQIFYLKSLQLVISFNAFIITTFKTKIENDKVWSECLRQEPNLGHPVNQAEIGRAWFFLFCWPPSWLILNPSEWISHHKVICVRIWGLLGQGIGDLDSGLTI